MSSATNSATSSSEGTSGAGSAGGRGISSDNTAPTAAAPAATSSAMRNAPRVGNSAPATDTVSPARIAPITALEIDGPSDRASALMPFAAAVSDTGTAALISDGIDANAKPTPMLASPLKTITRGA